MQMKLTVRELIRATDTDKFGLVNGDIDACALIKKQRFNATKCTGSDRELDDSFLRAGIISCFGTN